jgi:hypothetical protein
VAGPPDARGLSRSRLSRWLSRIDQYASRPLAVIVVVIAAGTWIIVSIAAGFPARWETIFDTVVAALTLAMVFVIQHTQARHQRGAWTFQVGAAIYEAAGPAVILWAGEPTPGSLACRAVLPRLPSGAAAIRHAAAVTG